MPDGRLQLYARFTAGQPGTCVFTGEDGCHAFATEDEIEATFGSRYDESYFVWIGPRDDRVGFVSDAHITALRQQRRIAPIYQRNTGKAALKAGYLLGATRMAKALALPTDDNGMVAPAAIATLPLTLRVRLHDRFGPGPAPHAGIVERLMALGATIDDPEARGRHAVLARAAVGQDLDGIEDDAAQWAAWAYDRKGREARAQEITRQIMASLDPRNVPDGPAS